MIIQHPTQPGWLINTPEVERLINAPHKLILIDGSEVHPLYFTPPDFAPGDVEAVRSWAYGIINGKADDKALALDNTLWFSEAQLPLEFAADELNRWYAAGSPASPPAAQYKIANQLSQVRGETIGDTITWMAGKWQTLYASTAQLMAQRYSFIQQVTNAADIDAIKTVLVAVAMW